MTDTRQTYKWYVREDGDPSRPTILLLHGFTGCVEMWDDIVAGLAGSFHCLRVDLPGHGRTITSDKQAAFTMPHVARGIIDLLHDRGITKTHLWGYSLGGRLALFLAVTYPERWHRLVLESASPGIADPIERQQRRSDDERLADEIERIGVKPFIEQWLTQPLFASQQALPEPRRELARHLRRMHTATGLARALRGLGVGVQPPLADSLPTLHAPTLILAGEHDAKFRPIGASMAAAIPRASLGLISGSGHSPHWECPSASLSLTVPFLLCSDPAPIATEVGRG